MKRATTRGSLHIAQPDGRVASVVIEPGTELTESLAALAVLGADEDTIRAFEDGTGLTKAVLLEGIRKAAADTEQGNDLNGQAILNPPTEEPVVDRPLPTKHPVNGQFVSEKDDLKLGIWKLLGNVHPALRRAVAALYEGEQTGPNAEGER